MKTYKSASLLLYKTVNRGLDESHAAHLKGLTGNNELGTRTNLQVKKR